MIDNQKQKFIQEYLYAEDYSLFYDPAEKIKEKDETPYEVLEIDTNHDTKTIINF